MGSFRGTKPGARENASLESESTSVKFPENVNDGGFNKLLRDLLELNC